MIGKPLWVYFIRIPVFVDKVETYGFIIDSIVNDFNLYKEKLEANNIDILVDVHVKHSKILSNYSLEESIKKAINWGANSVIITWRWTWDLPKQNEIIDIKSKINNVKIIIWSWVTKDNIESMVKYVDWFIVWTYFKTNKFPDDNVNIRDWRETIDLDKVKSVVMKKNNL